MRSASSALAVAPPLTLRQVDGRPAALPRPGVVLFWRSDCAPCRLELADLPALRRAAAPLPLQPVELKGAAGTPHEGPAGLRTDEDPAAVLTRWGGAPPRLPLTAAVDAQGRLCARHTGLIGRDRLKDWARACGGEAARR